MFPLTFHLDLLCDIVFHFDHQGFVLNDFILLWPN